MPVYTRICLIVVPGVLENLKNEMHARKTRLASWRPFRIFFVLLVRGRGKGRRHPSKWWGVGFLLKIVGGGGVSEEAGYRRHEDVCREERGGSFFFWAETPTIGN